jgi:hypothetical protein
MTIPALDADRSRFLAAVTLAAAEKFGADAPCVGADGELRKWRMARVGDLLLIDQPADECPPRAINVYFVEAEDINPGSGTVGDGKRFEFGPDKLLYGLRWLHNGKPPDLDLALAPPFVRAPEVWFPYVTTMLLGALQEVDPGLRMQLAQQVFLARLD